MKTTVLNDLPKALLYPRGNRKYKPALLLSLSDLILHEDICIYKRLVETYSCTNTPACHLAFIPTALLWLFIMLSANIIFTKHCDV
jgi:hypothetical protein